MTAQPLTFIGFASRHRLRTKRDACGDTIAPGRFGHFYPYNANLIGLILEEAGNVKSRARLLLARRRKALAAGLQLHQAGEAKAILLFEPGNPAQERFAIERSQSVRLEKCLLVLVGTSLLDYRRPMAKSTASLIA